MLLNRTKRITAKKNKVFNKKHAKQNIWLIATDMVLNSVIADQEAAEIKNNSSNGCTCRECGNYNEYAIPNQVDGSFVCFSCRNT